MLENATIARPYARAVFEHAVETGQGAAWSEALELLNLFVSDPAGRRLVANPRVSRERLAGLIFDIGGERLSSHARNLVKTLIAAGRLPYAPHIKAQYERMRAAAEGTVDVALVTAYPLDDGQREDLAAAMQRRLGRRVNITAAVDETLLGGAVIRTGDSVMDASLRGRLTSLRNQLA